MYLSLHLTWLFTSLSVLCMTSSCAFVAGQCNNKGMAWGKVARLCIFCAFACGRDRPVGLPLRSFGFISQHGSVCLAHSSSHLNCVDSFNIWTLDITCTEVWVSVVVSQQAWPTGTQQILIPSSWQQVPGVAIHSSAAHQSNVPESPLTTLHSDASTQQGHSWRCVSLLLLVIVTYKF